MNWMLDPVSILRNIIPIRSQNGIDTEVEMAKAISFILVKLGFNISTKTYAPNRPNLLCHLSFQNSGPALLFNTHMDTKPAIENEAQKNIWQTNPFVPHKHMDCIFGLGACDAKGSISSLLAAITAFLKTPYNKNGSITLHFVSDEEATSQFGTVALCKNEKIDADFAIVLEPTNNKVSNAQLGNMIFCTKFYGIGGHTGKPKGKTNAFRLAFSFIHLIDKWAKQKSVTSDTFQQPFMNVAKFDGGSSCGTIPDFCKLYWSIRILPNANIREYQKELSKIENNFNNRLSGNVKCITHPIGTGGIDSCICHHEFLDILCDLTQKNPIIYSGSTDAAFIRNFLTIPACVFGPGSLEKAHTPNESVPIIQLFEAKDILFKFLCRILTSNNN